MAKQIVEDDSYALAEAKVEIITPNMADKWLEESNLRNRKARESVIKRYAKDMAEGRWTFTGDPIQFDRDNVLLNGQHRLEAIARSGVTVPLLVIRGLPPESQDRMDVGAKRLAGDVLSINGHINGIAVAAAAKIGIQFNRYKTGQTKSIVDGSAGISSTEVVEFAEAHMEGLQLAQRVVHRYAKRIEAPSTAVLTFAAWRMMAAHEEQGEQFIRDLSEKIGLQAGDPVLALSRKFQDLRRNRTRTPKEVQLSMIFRAWNARRRGITMTFIKERNEKGEFAVIPEVL